LTNHCDDPCDKPPWDLSSALYNGLPWVIAGALILALGAHLLLAGRGDGNRGVTDALLAGIAVSAAAIALPWLFAWAAQAPGAGFGIFVAVAFLSVVWFALWSWAAPAETPS
jgi:hypothetical protein